ncbi:MAG: hypothetical protein GTO62_16365, partial [Planctomycetales bacterium]|nr:hypothetical protein [Planctomycetales bacterium]
VPTRDPKEWTWEGSQDGQAWQRLDHRVDEEPFPQRKLKQTYHFKNDTPYRFYRLTLLANHGEELYQLSEIALEGVAISPADGSAPVAAQAYR